MYSVYMDSIQLPVAPKKITLSVGNRNETVELMNIGEVNILKSPALSDIKLNIMLPHADYPFAYYPDGFISADEFLSLFEKLKVSDEPFRFIVSRVSEAGVFLFDTNLLVSMEDYDIVEDADNGLDIMVAVNLKQYKNYGTKTFEIIEQETTEVKAKEVETRPAKEPKKTYTVKSGDTLWAIAKRELGDGSKYPAIAKANNIGNPDMISIGQELVLNV